MKIGNLVCLSNTTNVVRKLTLSFLLFLTPWVLVVAPGFAQSTADYQDPTTGKTVPVTTLRQLDRQVEKVTPPQKSEAVLSILTAGRTALTKTEIYPVEKATEDLQGRERIVLMDRSQLFRDERTRVGVVIDRDGARWSYDHIAIAEATNIAPPQGYVEIGRFLKTEGEPILQAVYGKPAGEIEEIVIKDSGTFVYDPKTRTGAMITDSADRPEIKQYVDVRIVTESESDCLTALCTESLKDFSIPADYVEVGRFEEVVNILPDSTTIVANKLIYAKFDQMIDFLLDLKEVTAS